MALDPQRGFVTRRPRNLLVLVAVLAACALSGGAAVGAWPQGSGAAPQRAASSSTAATAAPPWTLAGPYPASLDLRALGKVSPVRQQENYSTCWIQSSLSSLESALLPGAVYDFSENNLANHMGSRLIFEGHADNRVATAYFARWDGPVLERSDPYPRKGRSPEGLEAVRHVQDVLYLPDRTGRLDNDALKWAVSTVGAASCAMAFQGDCLRNGTWAYYCPTPGLFLNHYVTVVGWDDAFPASSFLTAPPGDGAFLVKNSWGTDWGDRGYFWLSYYDADFGHDMAVFAGAEAPDDYDAIYQHDPLGWSDSLHVGATGADTAWFAARYEAAGTGRVAAVSFYAPVAGSSFEVRVASSVAGVAAAPAAAEGTALVGGYHTVDLTAPASVTTGDTFVVAVRLTASGAGGQVALERPSALIAPSAARGQSYVSPDGVAWTDLVTLAGYESSDVCLKAFVDSAGEADVLPPAVKVITSAVRRGGVAHVRYRLGDPAFSSASATVVLSVRTASGTTAFRTRIPGVQVGQAGEWSFRCDLPAGSYTVVGRAFDVAGHRQEESVTGRLTVAGRAAAGIGARR